ncbi:unnamed protein product [Prorocentrum cordatum]|uniref:SET domain-containing protein n=1 Tax=Prorocentrum cordatum TaxID=2364126 RepID=A0ABN9Q939_9DINO|nr:unnamed protein product [Polarella glacialis]
MSARGPGTGAAVVLAGPPPPVALANHSCDPNAEVVFACDAGGARATLRALRPIAPGEEVVHSYIRRGGNSHMTTARRIQLRGHRQVYGFDCRCGRCAAAAPLK